jgi:DUF2075 family protein/predicted GIY-YIG superfamily endonuclease
MTGFRIEHAYFTPEGISEWAALGGRFGNWPVVYTLTDDRRVYVGESRDVLKRMRQHQASPTKAGLQTMRVVIDETFNKSACLDLESHLIRWFSGDGKLQVLNGNAGIVEADYYDRVAYRQTFDEVFERLREENLFSRSIPEIENSDLFKLSPFKALTDDQAIAVEDIVEGLLDDFASTAPPNGGTIVVQGSAGTGKTVVGIYLLKLLRDIAETVETAEPDPDSMFSEFFVPENRALLQGASIAMVVPQQSLRKSVEKVFRKTPGLQQVEVLSPVQLGRRGKIYDLVVVDEAHRLNQRANQSSPAQNRAFSDINSALFGRDDDSLTQLDWVIARSRHRILLLDEFQSVRPADLPRTTVRRLIESAVATHRHYPLTSQMRVRGGADYIAFVRDLLSGRGPRAGLSSFSSYDFRFYDDVTEMHQEIRRLDKEVGLARLVAGFAWDWKTKTDRTAYDIELDGARLRWNQTEKDWINSAGAIDEVGSIHTVQGYDLNYAGVIIGPDLRYDTERGEIVLNRAQYRDKKGKENNKRLGITYSDDDLLQYVRNIYSVLLTRGMRGTFVYVCDPGLRDHLRRQAAGWTS